MTVYNGWMEIRNRPHIYIKNGENVTQCGGSGTCLTFLLKSGRWIEGKEENVEGMLI